MQDSRSFPQILPQVRKILEELFHEVGGCTPAMRMWQELMTEKDRRRLREEVDKASEKEFEQGIEEEVKQGAEEDVKHGTGKPEPNDADSHDAPPEEVELLDGYPGNLFERCYRRWWCG